MKNTHENNELIFKVVITLFFFITLYFIQLYNYLLFHGLTEVFSIVIAFCISMIAWNGRKYIENTALVVLGISYFFIGLLDILHTLSYNGMGVFTGNHYYANQLWIAARVMEAISLFTVFSIAGNRVRTSFPIIFMIYSAVTGAFIYSIFFSSIFPVCFVEGYGQTKFKIYTEYVICTVLAGTMYQLYRNRNYYSSSTFRYLLLSIIFTIISEISFTIYINNYGISNMVGHFSKIISFYYIYKAIIIKSISEPYDTIFHELNEQRNDLQKSDMLKTGLFSIISHDLNSPISGISSLIQLLDDEFDSFDKNELKERISEIRKSMDSTAMLLYNLLNWAKLELGGHKLRQESYNLKKLLDEALEPLIPLFSKKNVKPEADIPSGLMLFVDRDTFLVAARNILSNALKFSYPGDEVKISASAEGDTATVVFEDRGTGMTITGDLMTQAVGVSKTGTSDEKGSGLGMNLIRRFIEENGGSVLIASSPGIGTKITLRFTEQPIN